AAKLAVIGKSRAASVTELITVAMAGTLACYTIGPGMQQQIAKLMGRQCCRWQGCQSQAFSPLRRTARNRGNSALRHIAWHTAAAWYALPEIRQRLPARLPVVATIVLQGVARFNQ